MHPEAEQFIKLCQGVYPELKYGPGRWLDVGSFNINGAVADFVDTPGIGLDWREGPGVDVVSLIKDYRPEAPFDTIFCLETLEHDPWAYEDVVRMIDWLKPGGYLLITCAMKGRKSHERDCSPGGQHYANIDPELLIVKLMPRGTLLIEQLLHFKGDYGVLFRKKA